MSRKIFMFATMLGLLVISICVLLSCTTRTPWTTHNLERAITDELRSKQETPDVLMPKADKQRGRS